MNWEEYKKKRDKNSPRSWLVTIFSAIISVLCILSIIYMLKYLGTDGLVIFVIIIPTAIFALIFLLAAINGRKKVLREAFESVMYIGTFWPK